MSRIIPIPTTRVGDFFVRQRLTDQVQLDQLALFRLQNQISTGQRMQLPSEDAPAALRAINLQRLLDRKGQIRTNLQSSAHYLGAADSTLDSVSSLLIKLRADTVGVSGTLANDADRRTVIQQIDQALRTLVDNANTKSQGRYLFAGSRSQTQPYTYDGQTVEYVGNEGSMRSYVDLERLFDTNLTGPQVFGGISSGVEGTADLNPHLTENTLLSTINGGAGLGRNPAVTITVNNNASIVSLSGAVTLGDVARLIEAGAPAGTDVVAEVTGTGLKLSVASGNTISVGEVADGRTARQLGILTPTGAPPTDTVTGSNLNPAVLKTTQLTTLLGTKAHGLLASAGANNDILITATNNGTEFNGVVVEFIGGGTKGSELVTYDSNTKILTVQIEAGQSTAAEVAAKITEEGTFSAIVDDHDAISDSQSGTGAVNVTASFDPLTGGSGEVLDTASGLILTNGGTSVTLDTSNAQTVEDLLNLINGAELGLVAEINAASTGINVRSRVSGADFTIGENGGNLATQLGIRTYNGSTELAAFNRGLGVPTSQDPTDDDLLITARDGTELSINLANAETVQDVIDLINSNGSNGGKIEARLAVVGNGIELVDSTVGPNDLTVAAVEGSQAAEYLGFVPAGQTQISSSSDVLQSADRHTLETESVFNTLFRLRQALQDGDVNEIGRSLDRIDVDLNRVNFARAEIGARMQNLDVINVRLEDENVQLRSALSEDVDVDLVEAISNLTARQFAFEASLRTSASMMQLSLLNFI